MTAKTRLLIRFQGAERKSSKINIEITAIEINLGDATGTWEESRFCKGYCCIPACSA